MAYHIRIYSPHVLATYISDFTNTPVSSVLRKRQMNYLHSYLSHWAVSDIFPQENFSIVIEEDYIDSSFTEDFSSYYVKNFQHHKRNCTRIHFFKDTTVNKLEKIREGENSGDLVSEVKENYLGYIVIRPLTFYFIGKTCLKIWDELPTLITKECPVSLFGLDLLVNSIPFQEQDKVLSVCATSALWSYFFAQPFLDSISNASPYQITKMATEGKVLPDSNELTGLNVEMICDCLHKRGLETIRFSIKDDRAYTRFLHIFLKSKIPAILILSVFNESRSELGKHAVLALGDRAESNLTPPFEGDFIQEIYIHDDRVGPFARLKKDPMETDKWIMDVDSDLSTKGQESEYYKLTDIVLGIYPKIRLPFKVVRDSSYHFLQNLIHAVEVKETGKGSDPHAVLSKLVISISLKRGNEFKKQIRNSTFKDKEQVLTLNLPKYVWISSFSINGTVFFDFVFDSTENRNGNYILAIIPYNQAATLYLEVLNAYIINDVQSESHDNLFVKLINEDLLAFYNYYHRKESSDDELSHLYGELHIPEKIKPNEFYLDEIKYQEPKRLKYRSDLGSFKLDPKIEYYLWAIDEDGNLLVGIEDKNDTSIYKGHPTLLAGRKGRISGELRRKGRKKITWEINAHSGRYSKGLYSSDLKKEYLTNVKDNLFVVFFPDEKFTIDYDKQDE